MPNDPHRFGAETVTELARLCKKVFTSEGVPYNSDLFFILDERTERDQSACLVHHTVDPASGHVEEKQMRVSAGFAPLLLSNLEIAHLVIPGITDQVSETASEDDNWLESMVRACFNPHLLLIS